MTDSQKAFALRKEGKLDEALSLARELMTKTPTDTWTIRAYGWCLYDAVKRAEKERNRQEAINLMVEFNKLQIPEDDALLLKQRAHYQITLLGSETHLADGLNKARQKVRDYPSDPDAVRDYAWLLCDGITHATNIRNAGLAEKLFKELAALKDRIPQSEESLLTKLEWCRRQSDSDKVAVLLRQATIASKEGKIDLAFQHFGEALQAKPDSREAAEGLAWEIARKLGKIPTESEADRSMAIQQIKRYFDELAGLVQRPSMLHSLMLARITKFAEHVPSYIDYVRRWDTANLREEDYQPFKPEGKDESIPSLAERMATALGKAVKGLKRNAIPAGTDIGWLRDVLGDLSRRYPDHPWLPYYYSKALILMGDLEAARAILVPIVRSKQREFWVWAVLAETFPSKTTERLACLAKAALCPVRETALLNGVLSRLRSELESVNRTDLVSEINKIVPDLRRGPQVLSAEMDVDEVPVKNSSSANSQPAMLRALAPALTEYATRADAIVLGDIPWTNGVVSGRLASRGDGRSYVLMLYVNGNTVSEARAPCGKFPVLDAMPIGCPMAVRLSRIEGREVVVGVTPRDGSAWDVLPEKLGIVKDVNNEKNVTAIATGPDDVTLAYFDHFPTASSLQPGDVVSVRVQASRTDGPARLLSIRKNEGTPDTTFVRSISGPLRVHSGNEYGFIDDVYVPRRLLTAEVHDAGIYQVKAVFEVNRKTGKKGWRAVAIQSAQ